MPSMAGVSDMRIPLGIQKLGATAANTAATSPTQGPARDRPRRPTHSTTPAPRTAMVIRWGTRPAGNPKRKHEGASSNDVSGGWAAVRVVLNGSRKNWCVDSPKAVKPYQKAS